MKIHPVCLPELIKGTSSEYLPTLPRWGIASDGEYGELVTSEHRTKEKEYLLWRTPMASDGEFTQRQNESLVNGWRKNHIKHLSEQVAFLETFPTPLASDAIRMRYSEESLRKVGLRRTQGEYKKAGCNLSEWVAVFPKPQATSCGCSGARQKLKKAEENGKGMQAWTGRKLNPTWVEWLMGFPTGWTDLNA